MIWPLVHPLPPLPSVSSTGDTEADRERHLADRRGRKGVGEEPSHTTAREPGLL
jgi:hypothetical protein